VKSFSKNNLRLFTRHKARFFTIIAIIIVCIGFSSGVGEVENKVSAGVNDIYESQNVSDLYFKSKNKFGFSNSELDYLNETFKSENLLKSFCYEEDTGEGIRRVYYFDVENTKINVPTLIEGRYPESLNEVVVERKTNEIKELKVGDEIQLKNPFTQQLSGYKVVGIILNPQILNNAEEPSFAFDGEHLREVIYFNYEDLPIVNDVYVTIENRALFNSFSLDYEKRIDEIKQSVEKTLGNENVSVLSLYENFGIYSLVEYSKKVELISIIFVVFFLFISLLVVYSTMSRLFDEERGEIACMKTLGYSGFKILYKYLSFVFFGVIIGGIIAFFVGLLLTKILYNAFNMQYAMPQFPRLNHYFYYLMTFSVTLLSSVLLNLFTGRKIVNNKPVTLLLPKTPKSGKKVFIERIPLIWNRLSFKYKSTLRNVFLFKSRFLMTVISIVGSTVLVFSGLGLMDCALKIEGGGSLMTISLALLVFSAVLCALVIYNLTNINISERRREIATLMVLGYKNNEVDGYINREIYIMAIIGAIFGLPLGVLFVNFVFNLIAFGSIGDINWWTYIISPLLTVLFSFIATLLLRSKVLNTDMNASLKSVE